MNFIFEALRREEPNELFGFLNLFCGDTSVAIAEKFLSDCMIVKSIEPIQKWVDLFLHNPEHRDQPAIVSRESGNIVEFLMR